MRRLPIIFGLTALAVLAACGPEPEQADGTNASAAAQAEAPADGPVAAHRAAAPAEPKVTVLAGDGLRLGTARLAFGMPKAATIEALSGTLGRPPGEQGANEECGGGGLEFAAWPGEITIWFEGGLFAGWDEKGKLKTAGGIGLGSSRADLASLQGLEVEESTLGTEFRAGGLGGVLDSKSATAKVIHLWGGSTCAFR